MPTPEQKVCPECGGSGNHFMPEVAGIGRWVPCPTCKGTGRAGECGTCGCPDPNHHYHGRSKEQGPCPDPFHTGLEDQGDETSDGRDRQVRGAGSDNREGLARQCSSASGKRGDDITGPPSEELSEDQGGEGEAEGSGLRSASSGKRCDGCGGHGVVDENGNPSAWGRADSRECAHCDGLGSYPAEASGVGAESQAALREEVESAKANLTRALEVDWPTPFKGDAHALVESANRALTRILDSTESPSPTPEEGRLREALERIAGHKDDDWFKVPEEEMQRIARTALGDGGRDE